MTLALAPDPFAMPKTLGVASRAFRPGGVIPPEFTEAGDDVSPPLDILGMPAEARSLALVMENADAPEGSRTHWTFWNMPATVTELPPALDVGQWVALEGRTDRGGTGYRGPAPDEGAHRYFFRVFALCEPLRLPPGATPRELWAAMRGRCLAWGETMGVATGP